MIPIDPTFDASQVRTLSTAGRDAQSAGREFSQALGVAAHGAAAQSREDAARDAARQLVSVALIQPILAAVRDDPFKSDLFHGGVGEDTFGAQLDTILADRMVGKLDAPQRADGRGFPVVDAVYRMIMQQMQAGPTVRAGGKVDAHA